MSRTLSVLFFVAILPFAAACGQEPAPAAANTAAPPAADAAVIPDAEIEALAKAYVEFRDFEAKPAPADQKAREKLDGEKKRTSDALKALVEKVREGLKGPDPLALVDSWSKVFARAATMKKQAKPEGLGRLHEDKGFKVTFEGRELGFKYALYVPQAYDAKKTWPVVVCIHDKGSSGAKYLNEVWLKNTDPKFKELREQFIFVAPTIEERTLGDKKTQERIEFFDKWYVYAITRSLIEVIGTYNVDMSRICMDGCGQGGKAAMEMAIFWPKIAAVSARSAEPKSQRCLGNIKNLAAFLLVNRKDGIYSSEAGKATRDLILQAKEKHALDLEFKDCDPLPNDTVRRKEMGSQASDPVHDASAEILAWYLTKTRKAAPPAFFFMSNNFRRYSRAVWAVIVKGDADEKMKSECFLDANVDREKNVISVKTANVESFRLYLNDKIVDMDRSIKVVVDGKELKDMKVDRSLDYLLKYQEGPNANDPYAVMTGEIMVVVPTAEEPPAETPKEGEKK